MGYRSDSIALSHDMVPLTFTSKIANHTWTNRFGWTFAALPFTTRARGRKFIRTGGFRCVNNTKGYQNQWVSNRKFSGLSKLPILMHQQFRYPSGWFFDTQMGIKTDGFQNGTFWGLSKPVCAAKCTTASQPQSLAIFWIAGEIARNFRSDKQIWPFFIAKCIATATVSLPQRNRNLFPRKNRCVQFDRVNESQTSTANHRRETVHLGVQRRWDPLHRRWAATTAPPPEHTRAAPKLFTAPHV